MSKRRKTEVVIAECGSMRPNLTKAAARSVSYQYFTDGRRSRVTYPDNRYITYEYNSNGWLTAIKDTGTNNIVSYEYDAAGRRIKRTLENNSFTVYEYDKAGQLTNLWHRQSTGSSNTICQFQYGYDAVGNRAWVKRPHQTNLGDVYRYDSADQLTNVIYNVTNPDTTPTGGTNNTRYALDATGNRTTMQVINGIITNTTGYGVNALNQHTNVASAVYLYDAKGNLTNDGSRAYFYDYENRLRRVVVGGTNTLTYAYDALGRLVQQTASIGTVTSRYYYAGWQLIAEYNQAGTFVRKYVYGDGLDEPVRMTAGTRRYYYHPDALGSVATITTSSGLKAESYTYDVYGAPTIYNGAGTAITSSAMTNRLLFTARDYDATTTLYNYRHRYYVPSVGRFVQPDPINLAGGDLNLYRYVGNNSVNGTDPLGLWNLWNPATWGVGNGISGTIWNSLNPLDESAAWSGLGWGVSEGAAAAFDAIVPFVDPFEIAYKDECGRFVDGTEWSGGLAGVSRDIYLGRLALRGASWLGSTRLGQVINHNRWLRIGPGRMPRAGSLPAGSNVPRVSVGPQQPGIRNPHFDLRTRWEVR